jgi:predicted AlkP superfamily pyrophosphatase or phosphodiesterase
MRIIIIPFLVFLLSTCSLMHHETSQNIPKLLVFISIDGLNADAFSILKDEYSGGYRTLLDKGTFYTEALHDHAATETGPGHSVLLSGQYPGEKGVLGNNFYHSILEKKIYCIVDDSATSVGGGRPVSYQRIQGGTFGDWLKNAYPESKVLSVSGKDRAAVLMAGKHPDGAYWYNWDSTGFGTSSYYVDALPTYISDFNAKLRPNDFKDSLWTKLKSDDFYTKYGRSVDNYFYERDCSNRTDAYEMNKKKHFPAFPHRVTYEENGFDDDYYSGFGFTPFLDKITIELAEEILINENLGKDASPDVLILGLSSTDIIGHTAGSFSHEYLDVQLRIDAMLGEFMSHVNAIVGQDVVYVLTSDHGSIPLPEYLQEKGIAARRIGKDISAFKKNFKSIIDLDYGQYSDIFIEWNYLQPAIRNDKKLVKRLDKQLRSFAKEADWIEAIYSRQQILQDESTLDRIGKLVKHSWNPNYGPDWVIISKENLLGLRMPKGTSHGTPYRYDQRVPLIFMSEHFEPGIEIQKNVRTIDIAPTLAELFNISVLDSIPGKSLLINEME